jgi:hypothetical protein
VTLKSKTNQYGGSNGFVGSFVNEIFYQVKGKLFTVNDYIIFLVFQAEVSAYNWRVQKTQFIEKLELIECFADNLIVLP